MIVLTASKIAKRYGATRALTGLSLCLQSGSVIGIAGPNGAGKSTLMRILCGEEQADSGEITFTRAGSVLPELNVAVVHQEPQVWPNLTVRQNLAVGHETKSFGRVAAGAEADAIMAMLDIARFADFELADLSLAVHQRVEIARAMMHRADAFLFDEPNSALTDEESKSLFALMERLAGDGKIVLLITHRLNDFVNACKRVLILRDGRIVADLGANDPLTEAAIAAQLTTNPEHDLPLSRQSVDHPNKTEPLLRLIECSDRSGAFRDISMSIAPGILVLAGVEGSGARELARTIGGFVTTVGEIEGQKERSVVYVAASRRHTVFPNLSVGENIVIRLGASQLASPSPWLNRARIAGKARACLAKYAVKAGDIFDPVTSLSGGNQQKVVLGAALEKNADILVVEEPTRGVDVASKRDIYALMRMFCQNGKAVVLFCTEVPEMFDVADKIAVMSRGSLVDEITVAEVPTVTDLVDLLARYESGSHSLLNRGAPPNLNVESRE
jgi:ABC-type sugar transport system ATPase subunit